VVQTGLEIQGVVELVVLNGFTTK